MSELAKYAHLVAAVLLAGYVLFWFLILRAIRSEEGGRAAGGSDGVEDPGRRASALGGFRWPSPSAPPRLSLPALGWVFFAGLALTGVWILAPGVASSGLMESLAHPDAPLLFVKLALVVALWGGLAALARRPSERAAAASGVLTLLVLAISALLGQ